MDQRIASHSAAYAYDSPPESEPPIYVSDLFRMWHVWTDDPTTTALAELWKVWATDPGLAILAVRQQLQQVRDDYATMVIGVVETSHEIRMLR